jgi:serine/threonine protein kinase
MNNVLKFYENQENLEKIIEKSKLKLIDFGFSRTIENDQSCNTVIGTHKYLPKKIYAYDNYGFEVDFYSIGVVTYILLTGKFPFEGESEKRIEENVKLGNYKIEKDCKVSSEIMILITRLLNLNTAYINELEFLNKKPQDYVNFTYKEVETFTTSYSYLFLKSCYYIPHKNNCINYDSDILIVKIIDNYLMN